VSTKPSQTTAVIGTGRLARTLIPLLSPAGFPVAAVSGRRLALARRVARQLPRVRTGTDPAAAASAAGLVLLAVPDAAIAGLAADLGAVPGISWRGKVILHHAGSLGLEPLEPLRRRGASVGLLHPLQCLGRPDLASAVLRGSRARIEGTPKARALALRLARALGLVPLPLRRGLSAADRSAYHAAAALLSNDVVALLDLGADLLVSIGLTRRAAVAALGPLARGTLAQAEGGGTGAALTGPVVRGDLKTLQAHLGVLRSRSRTAEAAHRLLSRRLLELAAASSAPPEPSSRREIADALRGRSAGRRGGATV
jgi:predicted short-subunit dehydrogenase-like oxidoreductase (DUF2520 family)